MSDCEKDRARKFYRARAAAIQAMFEGYITVQRARLESLGSEMPAKERAAILKRLDKEEASMAKAYRRALKEMQ